MVLIWFCKVAAVDECKRSIISYGPVLLRTGVDRPQRKEKLSKCFSFSETGSGGRFVDVLFSRGHMSDVLNGVKQVLT